MIPQISQLQTLHFPFLEVAILIPLIGAVCVSRIRDPHSARRWAVIITGLTFLCTLSAWQDFEWLSAKRADDPGRIMEWLVGRDVFIMDQLSAPLLPLSALLYFLTTNATLKTKIRRFSFSWNLVSEAILMAELSCSSREPWVLISLLTMGTIPPFLELRTRAKSTRVYALYMGTFICLLWLGRWLVDPKTEATGGVYTSAVILLAIAVFIRSGMVPFHAWMTDLFENATFGTALLFSTPLIGAFACVRLVLPIASDTILRGIGTLSLVTAVYTAGLSLVQRDARRFFCYIFISHASLVFVGLEVATNIGMTGALCVWLSVSLSLCGFGLTLRALEARRGNLSLAEFQGLYEHTPALAVCFFLTGLASVGFPGTFGFVGTELLVDGAVAVYPYIGVAVVIAAALNGIAFVKAYFLLFTGRRYPSTVSLAIGRRERLAVLSLAGLILLGGLYPQYNVHSRHLAAQELLQQRPKALHDDTSPTEHAATDEHAAEAVASDPPHATKKAEPDGG